MREHKRSALRPTLAAEYGAASERRGSFGLAGAVGVAGGGVLVGCWALLQVSALGTIRVDTVLVRIGTTRMVSRQRLTSTVY